MHSCERNAFRMYSAGSFRSSEDGREVNRLKLEVKEFTYLVQVDQRVETDQGKEDKIFPGRLEVLFQLD